MELSEKEYVALFATLAALTKLGENLLTITKSQGQRIKMLEVSLAQHQSNDEVRSNYLN